MERYTKRKARLNSFVKVWLYGNLHAAKSMIESSSDRVMEWLYEDIDREFEGETAGDFFKFLERAKTWEG